MELSNVELALTINALYQAQVQGKDARVVANLLDRFLEVAKERGIVQDAPGAPTPTPQPTPSPKPALQEIR